MSHTLIYTLMMVLGLSKGNTVLLYNYQREECFYLFIFAGGGGGSGDSISQPIDSTIGGG